MSNLDVLLTELKAISVVALVDCERGQFAILDNTRELREYTSPPVIEHGDCSSCDYFCDNVRSDLVDRLYDYYDASVLIAYLQRLSGQICAGCEYVSADDCQNSLEGEERYFQPMWYVLALSEDKSWLIGYPKIDAGKAKLYRFPYCPNTHGDGHICWGNNDTPQDLVTAFHTFWDSGFNSDLDDAYSSSVIYQFGKILGLFWVTDLNPEPSFFEDFRQFPCVELSKFSDLLLP